MIRLIISFTLIFLINGISAAQQTSIDTLTLQQAIEIALKNNLNVQIANKEIKKNEYAVDEYNADLLPSFSGRSQYLYAPEDGYDPTVTNGGEYGLQLSADYTLYNGGLNHLAVNKANTNINLSELSLEKAKSDLTFEVRSVYYEIDNAKREVEFQTEALKSLQDYYNYLKESQSGGNATQSDVLKTEVDLNNAKINLEDAVLNLQKLNKELFSILFITSDTRISFISPAEIDTTLPPEESPDQFIEVKIVQMEVAINQFDIQTAQAERLPVINLSGDAGVLGVKPKNYKNDLGYSASVDINVPIFSWGKINAKIQQATVAYEQSKLKVDLRKKELKITKDSLLTELNLAKKKMEAYRHNVKTAIDNFYYSKALFIGGSGSTLEVLDAYRLLNDAKTNYNNSILNLQHTKAELLKLYGK